MALDDTYKNDPLSEAGSLTEIELAALLLSSSSSRRRNPKVEANCWAEG